MTIRELIQKLQMTDPDQEIFTAPTIALPSMSLSGDDKDGVIRAADPHIRYPVTGLVMIRDMTLDERPEHIVITFESDIVDQVGGPVN